MCLLLSAFANPRHHGTKALQHYDTSALSILLTFYRIRILFEYLQANVLSIVLFDSQQPITVGSISVGEIKFGGLPDKDPLFTKILPDFRLIFCPIMADFCKLSKVGRAAATPAPLSCTLMVGRGSGKGLADAQLQFISKQHHQRHTFMQSNPSELKQI